MKKTTFTIIIFILGSLWALGWMAYNQSIIAIIALSIILTAVLMTLGSLISFGATYLTDVREHNQLMDRTKSQIRDIKDMQGVLSQQNKALASGSGYFPKEEDENIITIDTKNFANLDN